MNFGIVKTCQVHYFERHILRLHAERIGTVTSQLGIKLRRLRAQRGLTLKDVQRITGLSPSFISMVENGRTDIALSRLIRLAEAYNVTLADILAPPEPDGPLVVTPIDEATVMPVKEQGVRVLLLAPGDRDLEPYMMEFEPGGSLTNLAHQGEEFFHVLQGQILFTVEPDLPRMLEAGQTAYFKGDHVHSFHNPGTEECVIIGAVARGLRPATDI